MANHGVSHFVAENHRKLIIVFTEVEHSREDKDVPTWKDESILGRLINHSHRPLLVIDLSNIPVSHQQLVRHGGNPLIVTVAGR